MASSSSLRLARTNERVSAPNRHHSFDRRERERRLAVDHDVFHTTDRRLQDGDCIKMVDGSFHFIQYVNSSGAYAVPLASVNHEVHGHTISFTAGGRTISVNSTVQVINPLAMGGSSPEYGRYVRMAEALKAAGRGKGMASTDKGVSFGDFTSNPLTEVELEAELAGCEGTLVDADTAQLKAGTGMAKKTKKAKTEKRDKATKTVRKCACGCGAETTGYFAPGHDAKLHGWIKKLADGRIDGQGKDAKSGEKIIPAVVLKSLELKATKDGFKAQNEHYYKDAD